MANRKWIKRGLFGTTASLSMACLGAGCMGGNGLTPFSASPARSGQVLEESRSDGQMASEAPAASWAAGGDSPLASASSLWDNPVTRTVKDVFASDATPASGGRSMSPDDPLSLQNPTGPVSPELYTSMGLMAEKAKDHAKAKEFYDKALSLAPDNAGVLIAYGHFEDRQGRLDSAANYYQQALQADPQHARAHNDLGLCFARQGQFPRAQELIRRAIQLQPDRPIYRNNMAKVLVEMGRPAEAVKELSAAFPPAQANYNVGWFLVQSGREQQATEYFAQAVRIDPNMTSAQTWLARLQPSKTAAGPAAGSFASSPAAPSAAGAFPVDSGSGLSRGAGGRKPIITNMRPNASQLQRQPTPAAPPESGGASTRTSAYQQPVVHTAANTHARGMDWPQTTGTPYLNSNRPSDRSRAVPGAGNSAPHHSTGAESFQSMGQSHESPWGTIPSPYQGSSNDAGESLQYPASLASKGDAAPAVERPIAPATIQNPYYSEPPDQRTSIRQVSGQVIR